MLAFVYLAVAIYLGDHLCRRFYRFASASHRWATAVLVGLLISSWFTYLAALLFCRATHPLFWADTLFFGAAALAIFAIRACAKRGIRFETTLTEPRAPGSESWDWITLGVYFVLATWMMFATFASKNGQLQVADVVWTDFGPHTALIQSFIDGNNFPTQYPYFAGEPIRYHFLFFFAAANLKFLGLSMVWSLNLLSVLTLVAMLALIMAFGQVLFGSRTVGRIASALFFFHGSFAFVPFLQSKHSLGQALHAIFGLREYLPSGYPYRGETWGIWAQSVFIHQRHFASAIGIFLIVLIFLVDRYREKLAPAASGTGMPATSDSPAPASDESSTPGDIKANSHDIVFDKSFVFSGILLGALPLWNALVFTSAATVLFFLLLLFTYRRQMLALAITAGIVGLPQVLFLRSSGGDPKAPSLFHWGYVIENPTIAKVIGYFGFTFALKWPLILLALFLVSRLQRRFFAAICSLLLLTFCFQFSIEMPANHKFLNIWLIIANLFAAYALWRLWHIKSTVGLIAGRVVAIAFALLIFISGAIDLFPIRNCQFLSMGFDNDPLRKWVTKETKPGDVFLSDRFLYHPILLAGRKIYYGCTLFTWSAGYDLAKREKLYHQMLESINPARVYQLLRENNISYVAFDNNLRRGELIKRPNEQIYANFFPQVYNDRENLYGGLTIYKVPETAPTQISAMPADAVNMFEGGKGSGKGEFDEPRGLTVDNFGNVLVSDTRNGRIEKFSAGGAFLGTIGRPGSGAGELKEPNGLAVDSAGNIYVADTGNHRVQKLSPDGAFIAEWRGPPPGFYGPRDIAIALDDSIYIVDQGRTRIVKLTPTGNLIAVWGAAGSGDGQFSDHTSVALDTATKRVYVADPRNARIQVFNENGTFLSSWKVPEWQNNIWPFQDLAVDAKAKRLYASSVPTESVLVFDLAGTKIGELKPKPPDKLEGPSSIALRDGKLYVLCTFTNRVAQLTVPTTP